MVTIYAIQFPTKEAYIGCTAGKIGKRMREHRSLLKSGKHKSKRFQQMHDLHGPQSMQIKSLETLPSDTTTILKRERELYWLNLYDAQGLLLNDQKVSFQPPEGASKKAVEARVRNGYRPSPESNLKRRLAQLGKPKGHGAKISATKQAKNRT